MKSGNVSRVEHRGVPGSEPGDMGVISALSDRVLAAVGDHNGVHEAPNRTPRVKTVILARSTAILQNVRGGGGYLRCGMCGDVTEAADSQWELGLLS